MNRRSFLLSTTAALLAPRLSRAAAASIDVLVDESIGTISPTIYGHFTENLGGCIYDGIWVGENSKVPNTGGIRTALIEHLKRMRAPVVRWPGGCFADSYDWRDGVGPRSERPRRTNFWADTPYLKSSPNGPQKFDPNQFGTNEFARFCKLSGAEPYLAGNLRSLTPRDFYQWIEYCNSPAGTTTLAELRAKGGSPEPLNVHFWGVGNESWGCGGSFTGDEYAVEFRRFTEWVPRFNVPLSFVASGPNVADYDWTRSFFTKLTEKGPGILRRVFGTALHYYCGGPQAESSIDFKEENWYGLLAAAGYMEDLVRNHWQIMGEFDPQHSVKLVVDEWGAWHKTDPTISPGYLWAYWPALRDALVSGITLDIFNRHADKVAMANAAQLVNNIHSSFIAAGEKFVSTPIFEVFAMYAAHQGGTSVRVVFDAPILTTPEDQHGKPGQLPALSGSCSVHADKVVLTVVNPDIRNTQDTLINLRGRTVSTLEATILTASDIHAHNTFERPDAVRATTKTIEVKAGLSFQFPPASVTKLVLRT